MRGLQMIHYSVHSVSVNGHPYRQAYNTYVRDSDYSREDFTDIAIGRW